VVNLSDVSGLHDDADLHPLIQQQADETLAALAAQGFIETAAAVPAASPPAAPAPAAPAPQEDVITQIERLGALKAQGLLTEEEFAAQKAKLLGL
jgi:hypothetical protein